LSGRGRGPSGRWALAAALSLAGFPPPAAPAAGGPEQLEITYLANEGFLIRSAESGVLIDAFVREPYLEYAAVPPEILDSMLTAGAPYDRIDLALVSHVHRDHFQASEAARFLAARKKVRLISSPDVVEALLDVDAGRKPQTATVLPGDGESITRVAGGVRVEFLRLSHGTGRHATVQNLGHVIEIGGRRVLHVGDAQDTASNFAPFNLRGQNIDVALIPYWYFMSEEGSRVVEEHAKAAVTVAVHVPPGEVDDLARRFQQAAPELVFFRKAGETRRF